MFIDDRDTRRQYYAFLLRRVVCVPNLMTAGFKCWLGALTWTCHPTTNHATAIDLEKHQDDSDMSSHHYHCQPLAETTLGVIIKSQSQQNAVNSSSSPLRCHG
jgi:hypothetical protein